VAKDVIVEGERFGSALRDDRSVLELRRSISERGISIGYGIDSIDSVEDINRRDRVLGVTTQTHRVRHNVVGSGNFFDPSRVASRMRLMNELF